ncbi:hypothetical protein Ancab_002846 [Ancistrocladus abbreviatus]
MDYQRIEQSQNGGGLSPGKLRSMLMGGEKKRNGAETMVSSASVRSQVSEVDDAGCSSLDMCKDVDVVTELPECSTSMEADSELKEDRRMKDRALIDIRITSQEQYEVDYVIGRDNIDVSSLPFEFQKAERALQRVPLAPFSKPAPSKWDDAQKWISSPSNRLKTSQTQAGQGPRRASNFSYGCKQSSTSFGEVLEQRLVPFEEPDTKRIDLSQVKKENGANKSVSWESLPYPSVDAYGKPVFLIENSINEPAISLSQHESSISIQTATTFVSPPSTAKSVSMRDMGTEMTPIASQEPSRVGTPVKAMSPSCSPTSSRSLTPPLDLKNDFLDLNKKELSEKEIQLRTRREIMVLGTQLGKMNIAAWASKEEDKDASSSLKNVIMEQLPKSMADARAEAWEEAEKAKYMARFEREELKIQAWENHQKAKTEAEMRKIEVEVERMRAKAQDKLMSKLAAARHKAEEKRAAAEAKRDKQAAKTEQQAEYIRKTGRIPSEFSFWHWCCR